MRKRYRKLRRRKHKSLMRNTIIVMIVLTLGFATGYSAFQTVISINAKGNIKDLTNDLLFWGQADNKDNTLTTLKDKSSHANDGILNNFDNDSTSGYNDDELIFDGVNDYVNIGYANYDFHNTQSYVIYVKKLSNKNAFQKIICNQGNGGVALDYTSVNIANVVAYNGSNWIHTRNTDISPINLNEYYTLIYTYDGQNVNLYINGELVKTQKIDIVMNSNSPMIIGKHYSTNETTNMSVKEILIYDRTLTEEEIKTITEGFERKYK